MCGFAGFLGLGGLRGDDLAAVAGRMGDAIRHRGPDDAGVWQDPSGPLALVHRRLSILDLSPAGHQPMVSAGGRYVIAFNGEIYNHLALRHALELRGGPGPGWRGRSDTETLLAAIEAWGLVRTLQLAAGMFAIALWDRQERTLHLARDRAGEKPLYYGWQNGVFLFGSELKALKAHPDFRGDIDRDAINLLLRHGYIPAPYSIYRGLRKLRPATVLTLQGPASEPREEVTPYWSYADAAIAGQRQPFSGNETDAADALDRLLRDAIAGQSIADVPVGAFLSGGVDSSTIVALMQAQATRPVKTFAIGFDVERYNEAEYAKAVAQRLGTEHHELYVTARQAMDVIPLLPALYDEPFADSTQIPNFLLSRMTREHVTVALTGDGGDELFGGYNRYFGVEEGWKRTQSVPHWKRRGIAGALRSLPVPIWNLFEHAIAAWTSGKSHWRDLANGARRIAALLTATDGSAYYRECTNQWLDPESIVVNGRDRPTVLTHPQVRLESTFAQMMLLDFASYLPDDILAKVDRAAMGVSLETRLPFLDHRVIEFAWSLPATMNIGGRQGKKVLKELLYRYVPRELSERPKMGFGVPIDVWLRGPLRDWAEALLDPTRLRKEGYLRPARIRQRWQQHLSGRHDWQYQLWSVLMFQAWLEAERRGA